MWLRNSAILLSLSAIAAAGCAGSEPASVLQVGSRNLKCTRSEISSTLARTTPKVREYLVGCDFMYTRVHCTGDRCYPAEPKPPCIGDAPCLVEDPVTLRWELPGRNGTLAEAR